MYSFQLLFQTENIWLESSILLCTGLIPPEVLNFIYHAAKSMLLMVEMVHLALLSLSRVLTVQRIRASSTTCMVGLQRRIKLQAPLYGVETLLVQPRQPDQSRPHVAQLPLPSRPQERLRLRLALALVLELPSMAVSFFLPYQLARWWSTKGVHTLIWIFLLQNAVVSDGLDLLHAPKADAWRTEHTTHSVSTK